MDFAKVVERSSIKTRIERCQAMCQVTTINVRNPKAEDSRFYFFENIRTTASVLLVYNKL
jgi:hypothetical protein